MKRTTYLSWSILLVATGALSAGDTVSTPSEKMLEVKTIHKTHEWGYDTKPAPGSSELVKSKDTRTDASLAPRIVQLPKQELTDEK